MDGLPAAAIGEPSHVFSPGVAKAHFTSRNTFALQDYQPPYILAPLEPENVFFSCVTSHPSI